MMERFHWNIIGHRKQLKELEQDLRSTNLAHAYLFAGETGIGKHTIAKIFAKILQCKRQTEFIPCLACPNCLQIEKGYQPDVIEFGDEGTIKIEQMRGVVSRLSMTSQSNFQVLLLQNIERMTPEAANALLKILEDPPPNVIFLFTTDRLEALLKLLFRVCDSINFMLSPKQNLSIF